ncbi:tyrosine-type recombinase/integrase [Cellulomonas bogoriensis]|uniref:Integrase n=1 Tax=Cellulomonas bogoriensis 69B4 = DSM 16987 TaxID=1386082 RepID=A0A0A0BP74_9CELL|nr:tyrosine-type recombinase/integrase [Cellulomonas bogoriensis]KGM09735.1 integrase [Cellulomonas bogoriensis 69B4 = DSM 16987]
MASIRERRRADGTRSFAVLWPDPDTGRQTSLTYDDERDARVARELIEAAGGRADEAARIAEAVRKPGPTVEAAITEHIGLLTGVGADTRLHYLGQLRAHIAPGLGSLPVSAMAYRHVAGWVRAMTEKGLSPKTVANVHGLLSAAMTTAVRLGYRADNPCVGVELPKSVATRDEMAVLTRDEFRLLLPKESPHYQPLVFILVATGLRWGEPNAPTAGDVDSAAWPATVRVAKAWKRDANRHWHVGPPKTKRARRTGSLPDELVDVPLPLVPGKALDQLLVTDAVDSQLPSSHFWTTTWAPALNATSSPVLADGTPDTCAPHLKKRPLVHDFRHTLGSSMVPSATDLFALQRRLGHESITPTKQTCAHLRPARQRAACGPAGRTLKVSCKTPRRAVMTLKAPEPTRKQDAARRRPTCDRVQ